MDKTKNNNIIVTGSVDKDFNKNVELYFKLKNDVEKLINDSEFFGWLDIFTLDNPIFYDDDFITCADDISDYDMYMISRLKDVYKSISNFLDFIGQIRVGYKSININEGGCYFINHNGVLYEIGVIYGDSPVFFCNRVNEKTNDDFITFTDILYNQRTAFIEDIFTQDPFSDNIYIDCLGKETYKNKGLSRGKKNDIFKHKTRLYNYRKK